MLSKSLIAGKYFWCGKEITETEYNEIKSIIDNRPAAPNGYAYCLTADLQWELCDILIVEENANASNEKVFAQ